MLSRPFPMGLLSTLLLVGLALPAVSCSRADAAEEVVVLAAASLRDACLELGERFEREHGARVVLSFAGSNLLAAQLLEGVPCDLFLSAGEPQMDAVEAAGLLEPGSRAAWLSNALVVVQPEPLPDDVPPLATSRDLADVRLGGVALADPRSVPAGRYARAWLQQLGLWEQVGPRVVPAVDVRAALGLVESGLAGAGVVYATDAAISSRVRVATRVPSGEGPAIVYPAALLRGAPPAARELLAFLRSREAREVLERHGFVVLAER